MFLLLDTIEKRCVFYVSDWYKTISGDIIVISGIPTGMQRFLAFVFLA